jgi:hypothetical protein
MSESQGAQIKKAIKTEYVRCAQDPVYFLKKYCYISNPIKGRVLFKLFPFQEEVLRALQNNNYCIINKSRQLGLSTLTAGLSLHMMLFNMDKTVLCIATKQETAKNMVTKVKYMYDNLPAWLKGTKPIENNKLSLKLKNGSQIVATSAASDAGRSYAVSLLLIDEAAFIDSIDKIYTSIKPTISTGGSIIALSSPNGVNNWFHKTYTKALLSEVNDDGNMFHPIELKWDVHPDRDEEWFRKEKAAMSSREIAQEYECDFLSSGNTVIESDIIKFFDEFTAMEPIEKRFMGGDLWIFKYPEYHLKYLVSADVARGDGSDFSTFHVIEVDSNEQVAEYKSQIGTREFAGLLMSVATEYNSATIAVENANIGWDVVNTIIERGYPNLYYSPRSYGDFSAEDFLTKMDNDQVVPGFSTTTKVRPVMIAKLEAYLREKTFIPHSKRLLEELKVFIWMNGKAQSQNGYNDDLIMALAIGLYIRDTSLKYYQHGIQLAKASMGGMTKVGGGDQGGFIYGGPNTNYKMNMGQNKPQEDLKWLLG